MTRAVIAVASIPAAHPYVAAVVATGDDILLLDDPRPLEATTPGQWWPPRLLEPDYLRAHIDDIDVVHLHFGFDAATPDRLADVVSVLRESSTPSSSQCTTCTIHTSPSSTCTGPSSTSSSPPRPPSSR